MEYPSKLIENAVEEISKLPSIGKKTALRLALHLLKKEKKEVNNLSKALIDLRENTNYCKFCYNIADSDICAICLNKKRNNTIVCVVEDTRDVLAIENTNQYSGLYHVLGGIIMPIEGISPSNLNIDPLIIRISQSLDIVEIILALPSTLEGDTTSFYITKKLSNMNVKVTAIARGVPIGGELEYTDEITLGRSIMNRQNM